VKGGLPEKTDDYSVVEIRDLKIYVPDSMSFTDDVAKIVDFTKRNGMTDVGVPNVKFNN
jgi:hypothetical protein